MPGTGGIPEAPIDGKQYARQDADWTEVEAGSDTYTKTEIDAQQEAQDVEITANNDEIARQQIEITNNTDDITKNDVAINKNILDIATNTANIAENTDAIQENTDAIDSLTGAIVYKGDINVTDTDAPVDSNNGDMYINNYNVDEPDTAYPVTGWGTVATIKYNDRIIKTDSDWDVLPTSSSSSDTYSKAEIDAQQDAQDVEIAKKANTADTYTKEEVDDSQDAQDVNIASNTTAIGTLSGQVSQNSEDIAELQDSIFFSSAYSADYPSSPNRDPEDGNMYLQNVALFTYSYADATQIFCSKTDESGNVRQFTAIKPGDSIVLNEVASPNYGRYELVTVEDVSDSYVVMNVIPKMGQGTVITGAKVAFQAFPKPDSESIWTEVDGEAVYDGNVKIGNALYTDSELSIQSGAGEALTLRQGSDPLLRFNPTGDGSFTKDIEVNGVTVGRGTGSSVNNTIVGKGAFANNTSGDNNVAVGILAMRDNQTGQSNTAIGRYSGLLNVDGSENTYVGNNAGNNNLSGKFNTAMGVGALISNTASNNTAVGKDAGKTLTTGTNNTLLGYNAQPASGANSSNEVVIGNDDVTRFTTVGDRFKYNIGASYNMLEMRSKDKNMWLRNLVYDNGDNSIISSGNITLQTGVANKSLTIDSQGSVDFEKDITVGTTNPITVGKGGGDIPQNTVVGFRALDQNTTGSLNSAFGMASLDENTTGIQNTAVGYASLQKNDYGNNNTALGFNSAQATQYKGNITAIGCNALKSNKQSGNTAVGSASLDEVVTGANNTAIGSGAGQKTELGNNNTLIGYDAQPSASSVSNEVTIGNDDVVTMRSHGGKYSWINDDAYTMSQQTSKDGNSFLRTKVFDDGAVNFEADWHI